jgi:uncharacterized membrane protein
MRMILLVHILGGALGLLTGYAALYATKGASLHRQSGLLFVGAMLTMAVTGMLISAVDGRAPIINIPAALLTLYLVVTALTTVRPVAWASRAVDRAGMLLGLALGGACFALAISAMGRGGPAAGAVFPLVLFGSIALVAGEGDRRAIRAGGLRGAPRLKRHLWRMCFALFVASMAFYLGGNRLPEALSGPAVRAVGVLLPIVVMSQWLWRLREKRAALRVSIPEV